MVIKTILYMSIIVNDNLQIYSNSIRVQMKSVRQPNLSSRHIIPTQKTLPFQNFVEVKLLNGDKYTGEVSNQLYDGNGVYIFNEQNLTYVGEFKQGLQHSDKAILKTGINDLAPGERVLYEGGFKKGKKQGLGTYLYDENTHFNGYWHQDQKTEGQFVFGLNSYKGKWVNGRREDKAGILKYGKGLKFEGVFKRDEFIQGIINYTNGDVYKGQMSHSQRNGYGVYYQKASGAKYQGQWRQNHRHGEGVIQYKNKDSLHCKFEHGKLKEDSFVRYVWANGPIFQGVIKNEKMGAGQIIFKGMPPIVVEDVQKFF